MPQGWVGYLRSGQFFPPSESIVINSLVDGKKDADAERRRQMALRVDLFRDDFIDQLRTKLGTEYEIENFSEIFKTIDASNNVAKKIVTNISTLYDEPPAWKLAKDDGGTWDGLRKQSNLQLVMPLVNQFTNLCNTTLLLVTVINGRLRYHLLTPDLVKVWQNPMDPTSIDAFAYNVALVDTAEQLPVWYFWSNGGDGAPPIGPSSPGEPIFAVLDSKDRVLHQEANPYRDENGSPILPVVAYHRAFPVSEFWDQTSGEDFVQGTLMICAMESLMNHLFRVDSHQQKYVKGEVAGMTAQVAGVQRFLSFRSANGEAVDVGQFRSQADWKGLRDVINDKLQNLCNNHGISVAAVELTGTPQSGFALKVRKEPLLEIRRRQVPLFAASDRELYAVSAAVWNYERKNARGNPAELGRPAIGKEMLAPSIADPTITYAEHQEPKTVQEQETELELEQVRMSMGLTNVVELMQRKFPELSIEQARARILENIKINRELSSGAQLVIGRAQVLPIDSGSMQPAGGPAGGGKPPETPGGAPQPVAAGPAGPGPEPRAAPDVSAPAAIQKKTA